MLSGSRTESVFFVIYFILLLCKTLRVSKTRGHCGIKDIKQFPIYIESGRQNSLRPGIFHKLLSGSRWRGKEQSSQPGQKKKILLLNRYERCRNVLTVSLQCRSVTHLKLSDTLQELTAALLLQIGFQITLL